MKRREFLINTMLLGAAGLTAPVPRIYGAVDGGYTGRLLITLQIDGGWDVSSYCDPKVNQPDELAITNWSDSNDIQTAGNIPYAPFANNADFFGKYYNDMLVINGIDAQTNSHTVGVVHNWSGRVSEGYPSMTAMLAAANAPTKPMAYLNFGGFGFTANLVASTRIDNVEQITNIAFPNVTPWDPNGRFMLDSDFSLMQQFHAVFVHPLADFF